MMIKRIILASASPRRREILERFNIKFDVIPSDADENISPDMPHSQYVETLARIKGEAVRDALLSRGDDLTDTLIISCDTIVSHAGKILGKPKDERDAYTMLTSLSGDFHDVLSGLSLIYNGKSYIGSAVTRVKFAEVLPHDAQAYVDSGEPMGKAGAYAIQGKASAFVESIEGDFYNIVGFPLALFSKMLAENFGVSVFDLSDENDR
ncbi:MAG: septum formation protein Maf [Clostridiales bacterium]|nr:septum formation protein Maf [Clostridiales bacterium]